MVGVKITFLLRMCTNVNVFPKQLLYMVVPWCFLSFNGHAGKFPCVPGDASWNVNATTTFWIFFPPSLSACWPGEEKDLQNMRAPFSKKIWGEKGFIQNFSILFHKKLLFPYVCLSHVGLYYFDLISLRGTAHTICHFLLHVSRKIRRAVMCAHPSPIDTDAQFDCK